MKLTRKLFTYDSRTKTTRTTYESYEQPVLDRVRYLVVEALDKLFWVKPLRWMPKALDTCWKKHHKHSDKCMKMSYQAVASHDGGPPAMGEPAGLMCTSMPPSARVDLRLYDLDQHNNTNVVRRTT